MMILQGGGLDHSGLLSLAPPLQFFRIPENRLQPLCLQEISLNSAVAQTADEIGDQHRPGDFFVRQCGSPG